MGKIAKKVFEENFTQEYFEERFVNLVAQYSHKKASK